MINKLVFIILSFAQIKASLYNNTRITFGSCNGFFNDRNTSIFKSIAKTNSDAFIWLGDSAHVDMWIPPFKFYFYNDRNYLESQFNRTKYDPNYKLLRETTQVYGVWDDHDYGIHNGDKTFEHKDLMKEIYLDFIDEPKNSQRRTQKGGNGTIKVILLDNRYERDPESIGIDVLGAAQWEWLERELITNTARITLLMAGTQFFCDDRRGQEYMYIPSQLKLYKLLYKYKTKALFFSGDVHSAEMLYHPCAQEFLGYPMIEVTASGLTEHYDPLEVIPEFVFDTILNNFIYTDTYNNFYQDRFQHHRNFGQIDVSWNNRKLLNSKISLSIVDKKGIILKLITLYYSDLFPKEGKGGNFEKESCVVLSRSVNQRHMDYLINQLFFQFNISTWIAVFIILLTFYLTYLCCANIRSIYRETVRYFRPKRKRD